MKLLEKVDNLLDIIENTSDTVLYVEDETKIRVESNNYSSLSPICQPSVIEKNGSQFIKFLKDLLNVNKNKRVFMIWYNARTHTYKAIEEILKYL